MSTDDAAHMDHAPRSPRRRPVLTGVLDGLLAVAVALLAVVMAPGTAGRLVGLAVVIGPPLLCLGVGWARSGDQRRHWWARGLGEVLGVALAGGCALGALTGVAWMLSDPG